MGLFQWLKDTSAGARQPAVHIPEAPPRRGSGRPAGFPALSRGSAFVMRRGCWPVSWT